MSPAFNVEVALASELQARLGDGYEVLAPSRGKSVRGIPLNDNPAVAVVDRARGTTFLVAVTGGHMENQLPVAAAWHAVSVRDRNRALDPHLILVSTSQVWQMIRDVLARDGVDLVVTDQPSEAVSRVTSLIRAAA
jgi:hypothetical protein